MASDDEDYMSDKYLVKENDDVRPGLPKRKKDQFAFERYKKKLKADQENKEGCESNVREKGLSTAISSDNKGFQMLAKMGYKTGNSLGMQNKGIVEPISINIRNPKSGLGISKAKPASHSSSTKIDTVTKVMEDTFRKTVQDKQNVEMIKKYYRKAQTSCVNLDQGHGINLPIHEHYWPKYVMEDIRAKERKLHEDDALDNENESRDDEEQEENEDGDAFIEDQLEEIVHYLRETYFYCIYCSAKATDPDDLNSFCPGSSYLDHDDD